MLFSLYGYRGHGDLHSFPTRRSSDLVAEMASHAAARTADRVTGREIIVVQDTSELHTGELRARADGLGPVGQGGGTRGLLLHAALAIDADNDAYWDLLMHKSGIETRA